MMASRVLGPSLRLASTKSTVMIASRSFQSSAARLADVAPLPVKKPVGAFRGGLFGFLMGSTATGAGVYYYVLEEYKVSNELLTEDIYNLQSTVQKTYSYIQTLEERLAAIERKK